MKKSILLALLFIVIVASKSFSQDNTKVLFNSTKIKSIGFYIAPEYQYGQVAGQFTSLRGFSGSVLMNNRFAIGLATQTIASPTFSPSVVYPLYMQSRVNGLKVEYSLMPTKLVHVTIPVLLGTGNVQVASNFGGRGRPIQNTYYVIQPGVQAELNLLKYVKVYAGVNYRFTQNKTIIDLTLPNNTLQGLSINIGTKLGLFEKTVGKK